MEAQAQGLAVARVEQAVLDHLRRRAHQAEGVRVAAALVAGDVEHAEQAPVRRRHRGGRAGEEAVAFEIVLGAMHDDGTSLGERGADGVGAAVPLVPGGAAHQRDALGAAEEIRVAEGLQQHTAVVGEDHHAAGIARLGVQVFHHRPRVGDEFLLTLGGARELEAVELGRLGQAADGGEAGREAAAPGARHGGTDEFGGRRLAAFDEQMARLPQGRAVGRR